MDTVPLTLVTAVLVAIILTAPYPTRVTTPASETVAIVSSEVE